MRTVGLASHGWIATLSSTPRKRSTLRTVAVVVGAEVLVDQHQHPLGPEHRVVAAQLLDVAHALGVAQHLGQRPSAHDRAALQRERRAQIALALDVILQVAAGAASAEARGLAQDRDDPRVGLQLGDAARRPTGERR